MALGATVLTIVLAITGYVESVGAAGGHCSPRRRSPASCSASASCPPRSWRSAWSACALPAAQARHRGGRGDVTASRRRRRRDPRAARPAAGGRRPDARRPGAELRLRLGARRARRAGGASRAGGAAGERARSDDVLARSRRSSASWSASCATCCMATTDVVGTVTTGGTESCLLAVKTARDVWLAARLERRPRRGCSPRSPCMPRSRRRRTTSASSSTWCRSARTAPWRPTTIAARLGDDVALVVVSAPNYPLRRSTRSRRSLRCVPTAASRCMSTRASAGWCCRSGPACPPGTSRSPGVTSVSADLHKFGYAPKGVSVLLQRGRDRQRTQYFATTRWPGYPVVNPTILGSKSAGPLAAAWAITEALGVDGFAELAASCLRSTEALRAGIDGIEGLRVVGEPGRAAAGGRHRRVGRSPSAQVDPHHWADAARDSGWILQLQPGCPGRRHRCRRPRTSRSRRSPRRVCPSCCRR